MAIDALGQAAAEETREVVEARVGDLEIELARELRLPLYAIRRRLLHGLRSGEIVETTKVAAWLAELSALVHFLEEPEHIQVPDNGTERAADSGLFFDLAA